MFAISEANQSGQSNSLSSAQQQVIASIVAQQKVIAAQRSDTSGGATTGGNSGQHDNARAMKNATVMSDANSAEARSVVEAQEASAVDQKIAKAFAARHELNDLLSVIRDPNDRLLPIDPEDLG